MFSLSRINITQQPSNQSKKWRNEAVRLCTSEFVCQCRYVCVCVHRCVCVCAWMCICLFSMNERQISIGRTLNNRANQSCGWVLIKKMSSQKVSSGDISAGGQ